MRAFTSGGSLIVGTYDMIPGISLIADGSFLPPNGGKGVEFEHLGETEVDWNSQQTLMKGGRRIFVAEDGTHVTEDELVFKDFAESPWPAP